MIIESVKSTETDSAKWLSSRNRSKEQAAQMEKAAAGSKKSSLKQKPISRFHSRRGCANTLTFMDMDHLPEILTRRRAAPSRSGSFGDSTTHYTPGSRPSSPRRRRMNSIASETSESPPQEKKQETCVITGKIARYRDPKTMMGYHDIDAFRELRRRVEAGELKISSSQPAKRRKKPPVSKNNGVSVQRNALNSTTAMVERPKTHFPFPADQPTMVAELSSSTASSVKVMVTQGGVPVSPPRIKIHLKLPAREGVPLASAGKKPPTQSLPAPIQSANANMKAAVDKDNAVDNDDTTEKVPSPLPVQIGSGKAIDNTNPMANSPKSSELQTSFFAKPAASVSSMPVKLTATGGNEDNRDRDGAETAASETVATMLMGTNVGKVERKKMPTKDISARADDGDSKTVPAATSKGDKRTTIEAN